MDEAEKYQQRLQAIAEKRRLQEEQDRAKRALEDEKLRLKQQKRKSLRDQWLMEGPPTSPDSAGPRSPLWGAKAQQIEAHIEKLQSETERLGEAVERLQDHTENSSDSTQPHMGRHGNREGGAAETTDHLEEVREVTEITEVTAVSEKASVPSNAPSLTNGMAGQEGSHSAPYANGLGEGTVTLTFLGFSEAEPGQGVCDDDSAIIRAERVIIMDEGEEEPAEEPGEEPGEEPEPGEKVEPADRQEEKAEPGGTENHLEAPADINHEEQAVGTEGEEINTETNAGPHSGSSEDPDTSSEAVTPAVEDSLAEGVQEQNAVEEPASSEPQLHTGTVEGAVEASQAPAKSRTEHPGTSQQELNPAEPSNSVTPALSSPEQFQDVPLDAEGAESSRKQLVEEEPLLSSKAAPLTDAAGPNRAGGADGPKRKTCQCCSIM